MAQSTPLRLMVFVDAQNAYRGAREAFFLPDSPHTDGQFDPVKIGHLLESKGGPPGTICHLTQVRVYTGRPDSTKDPRTYGAHMRQCSHWEKSGAIVIPRTLRYPRDWPKSKAQEKGIDVSLALDFVTMAVDGLYDIGVIVSTDTDLVPALEAVSKRCGKSCYVATAAWRSSASRRRLAIQSAKAWCHWLDHKDYDSVADLTNYSIKP